MELLEHLNNVNDVEVIAVADQRFASYGRVLQGYDVSEAVDYMTEHTAIPEDGNCYVASVPEMEELPICRQISNNVYGGMPIQIGYCNGRNNTYNGFEYHKGSEINVAVTDCMLVLGHSYEITDNHYDISQAQVFFMPKGTVFEMYQTTLHLSPLRVCDEGFKAIVILPRGTNTPLTEEEKSDLVIRETGNDDTSWDAEQRLLLQRNKWVIAHPDREPLIRQGAYPGVTGVNKELYY